MITKDNYELGIVTEVPLTIFLNDQELITLLTTDCLLKELAIGYLLRFDYIERVEDIDEIVLDDDKQLVYVKATESDAIRGRYITAGCSISAVYYRTMDAIKQRSVDAIDIELDTILTRIQPLKNHPLPCLKYSEDSKLIEDITTENALMKLYGLSVSNAFLVERVYCNSLLSAEAILIAGSMGISNVNTLKYVTNKSVSIAKKMGLTLIGRLETAPGQIYC